MNIINNGADSEDFDEMKIIMDIFMVGMRMKELTREK